MTRSAAIRGNSAARRIAASVPLHIVRRMRRAGGISAETAQRMAITTAAHAPAGEPSDVNWSLAAEILNQRAR